MKPGVVQKSLLSGANFMEKRLGVRPKFVRIPYSPEESPIVSVIEQAGFIVTQHNLDSHDYNSGATVDDIFCNFELSLIDAPKRSSSFISVQRDRVRNSNLAVPHIARIVHKNGYKFVTLSECLGISK